MGTSTINLRDVCEITKLDGLEYTKHIEYVEDGEIALEKGRVQQENLPDYEMVRLASAWEIHVEIIRSGSKIGGEEEPGTPPIAQAVTNAVFALTGKRIRALPVKNHTL